MEIYVWEWKINDNQGEFQKVLIRERSLRTARRQLPRLTGRARGRSRRAAPSARRKLPRGRSAPKGRHDVAAARVIAITPRSRGTCKTSHASLGRQLLARNTTSRSVGRSFLQRARVLVREVDQSIAVAEDRERSRGENSRKKFGYVRAAGSTNSNGRMDEGARGLTWSETSRSNSNSRIPTSARRSNGSVVWCASCFIHYATDELEYEFFWVAVDGQGVLGGCTTRLFPGTTWSRVWAAVNDPSCCLLFGASVNITSNVLHVKFSHLISLLPVACSLRASNSVRKQCSRDRSVQVLMHFVA